jgi:tripartite-type tricarboxylate transporter receptor subunit TctC
MRRIVAWLCAAALAAPAGAWAQGFPAPGRTVRILVGFVAGGGTDIQARLVAPKLSEALGGIPVVIENKPGASGMVAAQEVVRSAPDGYTLLYTFSGVMAQNPHTFARVPYDPFRDFTPLSQAALGPLVLVAHTSVPATNLGELIAHAKANPGKVNCASFGTGSSGHINCEVLKLNAGIDIVHVPYKGGADAYKDLLAGRVQIMFDPATTAIPNTRAGRVRMIGVVAEKRQGVLPEVPTIAEQGVPDIDIMGWLGFFGPAGMPPELVKTLNAALVKAISSPEVKDGFIRGGYEAVSSTPSEFAAMIKDSYERWGKVVRKIGLKAQ